LGGCNKIKVGKVGNRVAYMGMGTRDWARADEEGINWLADEEGINWLLVGQIQFTLG
jgi:hypothetical protein